MIGYSRVLNRKEAIVAYFKVTFRRLSGGTKETYENRQWVYPVLGPGLDPRPSEHDSVGSVLVRDRRYPPSCS